jgi:hypothetical protein
MSGVTAMRPASRPTLFALSLGHGCADLCSGGLFGLLPFLVAERHYSLAAAGVFAFIASAASAVFQPLVGAQGDPSRCWPSPSAAPGPPPIIPRAPAGRAMPRAAA